MGYFAEIGEDNKVKRVISVSNEVLNEPEFSFPDTEPFGRHFISNVLKLEGEWRQTSYNGNFRGRYAGIGFTYDRENDEFVDPTPPRPNDGKDYTYDSETNSWVELQEPLPEV